MPLAMNVFGTDRRLLKSLGLKSFDQITEKIGSLLKPELPQGFMGMRDALGKLGSVAHIPPKKVKDAPVQEVVLQGDQVDLDRLPALFTWPEDGGSFFNLGLTHTKSPVNGMRNLGLYRLQRHDKRTIGMHWQIHKNSHNHYQLAAQRGERLPVAIAFGCPPAVTYASTAPLPGDMDEYLFAGFLQGKRVEMVDCKTVPLQVPAQAEVVLEGWLEPGEMLPEGPFGDHTGFYTPQEPFPALTIDCVTMRRRPLLQSIVVGRPPTEDGPLGRATERFFLPLLKIIIPDIVDYHLPEAAWLPQLRDRLDRQEVPEARAEGHARHLGRAHDVADQADHRGRRRLRRPRPARGRLAGAGQHRLRPGPHRRGGPGRPPRPLLVPAVLGRQGRDRRDEEAARGGVHPRRRLARDGRLRPGHRRPRRPAVEGVRTVSASAASEAVGPEPVRSGKVKSFLRLVMIEHSVFALPFAYIAAFTAGFLMDGRVHWLDLLLVTIAMVGLRTFAMAANRIIDREIDARNPRTATRELVTGAVSVRSAWTGALVALAVFLAAAAALNPLCLALAPVAVVPMVVYPYGKRFTHYPHAILGLAQAMGPVGAWLAITGAWSWRPWCWGSRWASGSAAST